MILPTKTDSTPKLMIDGLIQIQKLESIYLGVISLSDEEGGYARVESRKGSKKRLLTLQIKYEVVLRGAPIERFLCEM